jgi:hypothetical protein
VSGNFDQDDIRYLANTLSVAQLRHEIHHAETKAAVAEVYRNTEYQTGEDLFPWPDYAGACREAIKVIQQSKPKAQPAYDCIDTEAIKAKNDIVAVVGQYTRLRKTGKNFTGRCPIHQDKNPSLTVYPEQQAYHCYGCNRGGDVIAFIEAIENCDFKTALGVLDGTS